MEGLAMNSVQRLHDHSRDDLIPFSWRLKPGMLTERLTKAVFFLGAMEIGIVTLLATSETAQKQATTLAIGLLPIFLASLFIGLRVAPFVLGIMSRSGFFGTVRVEKGRLELPGGGIDLRGTAERGGVRGRVAVSDADNA